MIYKWNTKVYLIEMDLIKIKIIRIKIISVNNDRNLLHVIWFLVHYKDRIWAFIYSGLTNHTFITQPDFKVEQHQGK